MPDLVREFRTTVLISGDHPDVDAEWGEGPDRRVHVTVSPVSRELVRLVHGRASGDFSQVVYEGPVGKGAEERSRLRVKVQHANSIVGQPGATMTFWSTGVPEQVE